MSAAEQIRKVIFLSSLFVVAAIYSAQNGAARSTQEYKNELPFYSISKINQGGLPKGRYNTEGFVVFISACPPCSEGAVCESCLKDHLIVSEAHRLPDSGQGGISRTELVLLADNVMRFKTGEKYKFSIEVPGEYNFDGKWSTAYQCGMRVIGSKASDDR